jgi:hypothetical protein
MNLSNREREILDMIFVLHKVGNKNRECEGGGLL